MAPQGRDLNAVTPGVIETDMTADLADGLVRSCRRVAWGSRKRSLPRSPSSSPRRAAYVNGATLSVDGALGA